MRIFNRLLTIIFSMMFCIFCLVAIYKSLFSDSSVGTISIGTPTSNTVAVTPATTDDTSKYATFTIPSGYRKITTDPIVAPTLENFSYITKGTSSQLSIQVMELASGSLSDDSTYHYRSITPERYKKSTVMVQGRPVVMFTDEQLSSRALYLQNGTMLGRIALTGDDANDQVMIMDVANSWRWL